MSSAALSGATEAELRAALDAALELAGAADREAARQNAQMEQAEAQAKAHQQARERVETHAKAMQAACRRASVDNKHLEEETKKLSEECAARRLELHQKMESAIGDVKKSAEAAASERARIVEENVKSVEQLRKFGAHHEAAKRHREAEAHAKAEVQVEAANRCQEVNLPAADGLFLQEAKRAQPLLCQLNGLLR